MNAFLRLWLGQLAGAEPAPVPSRVPRCRHAFYVGLLVALFWGQTAARADVPVNGRHQELDFTSRQVQAMAAASYAGRIAGFRRQGILDSDARLLARVRRVMSRLLAQAVILKPQAAHWGWEVHVADSDHFDAFCMAGGKILVSSVFLEKQQLSDGELAALLAHEIAHALAEHVREQLSAVRRMDPAYAHLGPEDIVSLMGWDFSVSLRLADLSRLQELEADDIGIYLAAKSGYDPRTLVQFYRKLNRVAQGQVLIDTHGAADSRLRAVENFAAYAETVYRENSAHRVQRFVLQ